MTHARIAIYQVRPGTADGILQQVQAELVPQVRAYPGFVGYTAVRTGPDAIVSISAWQTREHAEHAAAEMSAWVRANLGAHIVSAEQHVGEVVWRITAT